MDNLTLAEAVKRGHIPNLSLFARTATREPKTLEVFGAKRADGKFAPFKRDSAELTARNAFVYSRPGRALSETGQGREHGLGYSQCRASRGWTLAARRVGR